mgnify:CR=1 FL=1
MTQLPEPNFIERDPDKIIQEWISLYEEKSGKTLQPAQLERLMVDVGAYRESVLRNKIQEVAKQNLLNYAPIDILEHIGEPLGVTKLKANAATTMLKFSIDEPLDFVYRIEADTEVESKDGLYIFKTIEAVNLEIGETDVTVKAVCETAGIGANNYTLGSINNLITPLSYISKVENVTVTGGGADDEEAENLRERIREAPEKFSNAGSRGAYKYHTLSAHQSITDVAIITSSPGVVSIYPLTDTGNPNQEVIDIVQNYLSDDKIRPLTDYVQVISPQTIHFEINATIWLYQDADEESVISIINSKMAEYKKTLSEKLGKDVINSQIISLLNTVYGVYKVELETPDEDITIQSYQWADLSDYFITIGGYADE